MRKIPYGIVSHTSDIVLMVGYEGCNSRLNRMMKAAFIGLYMGLTPYEQRETDTEPPASLEYALL